MKTMMKNSMIRSIIAACLILFISAMQTNISAKYHDKSGDLPGMMSGGEVAALIIIPIVITAAIVTPILIISKKNKKKKQKAEAEQKAMSGNKEPAASDTSAHKESNQ